MVPPTDLELSMQEVHLWRAHLDRVPASLQTWRQTLSADEQQRADRFRFPSDRDRFIAGRAILRAVLGRYLNLAPQQLQFGYEAKGKPYLSASIGQPVLQFNLSHSQEWMLCAVTYQHRVGIDLECIRPVADLEQLTNRFFLPREHDAIHALPAEHQQSAFFRYWTCKEAILKAIGTGLVGLSSVEILLTEDRAKLLSLKAESDAAWYLHSFVPMFGYTAAIAVEQPDCQLIFWQWQDTDFNK